MVDAHAVLVEGPWEHRFIPANGARFHVAVAGPDTTDTPLVLLVHGFPQFWWAWRHQLTALAARGYRAAAVDLRGSGASDKPPLGYDVPTLTRDLAGIIRSLGARSAVVVGHGLGGVLAWSMPALHPGVTDAVAAVSAPPPLRLHSRGLRLLRPRTLARLAFFQVPWFPERRLTRSDLVVRLLRDWGGPGWPADEEGERYAAAMRVHFAAHSAMEAFRWLVRSRPRTDGRRYITALRSAPDVPRLQVYGAADGCYDVGRVVRALGASQDPTIRVVPGAGHFVPEEAPLATTEALLGWLDQLEL